MSQIETYCIALTNLYGLVHKDKVLEIYNLQNEDQISLSDLEELMKHPPQILEDYFIFPEEEYFVHETVLAFDGIDSLLRKKKGKPYYIPKKSQLLKYFDGQYFEKSKFYDRFLIHMKNNFFKGEPVKAEEFCEDIYAFCQIGSEVPMLLNRFNDKGIDFKSMNHVNEVVQMLIDLSNHVKIWENNGYSPHEIMEKMETNKLISHAHKPFDYQHLSQADIMTKMKIGRNDLCRCGSGKKYKKCCLSKEH